MISLDDPTAFDVVHGRQLKFFPELVTELGGDPYALASCAGMDARAFQESGRITYPQIIALLESTAAELDCADFGMRLALRQGATSTFGRAGAVMAKAPTFGEALQFMSSHHYAHSLAAFVWIKRYQSRGEVEIGHAILTDGPLIRVQTIEQIFLIGHLLALELTGGRVRSRCVMFRHQPVSSLRTYRRHFGCEVLFGQPADAILYHDRDLACPTVEGDREVYQRTLVEIEEQDHAQLPPLRMRVRVSVTHFLNSEFCTRPHVAETMKLHPRTMDRRLRDEGTSFLQIRDEVRRDLLRYYVEQTGFDFTDISERLGFSEQSVMCRQCRKWFSMTPTQLRAEAEALRRMAEKPLSPVSL